MKSLAEQINQRVRDDLASRLEATIELSADETKAHFQGIMSACLTVAIGGFFHTDASDESCDRIEEIYKRTLTMWKLWKEAD